MTYYTQQKVEELQAAYDKFVTHPEGHWKGQAVAVIPQQQKALVHEAMCFMGSIVDQEMVLSNGEIVLYSKGYWAHSF